MKEAKEIKTLAELRRVAWELVRKQLKSSIKERKLPPRDSRW